MKATSRKTGVQGASNIAAITGVPMVVRMRIEVAHRLRRLRGVGCHHLLEDSRREKSIDTLAGADEQPVPDEIQARQSQKRQREGKGDKQESGLAAGRNHAVVDLQHVQGRCEVQHVDQQAEARGCLEMRAALTKRVRQRCRHFHAEQLLHQWSFASHPASLRFLTINAHQPARQTLRMNHHPRHPGLGISFMTRALPKMGQFAPLL